jgi:hypothetical protein
MAQKKVALSYNNSNGQITVQPAEQELFKDDWITFVTEGSSMFTIIIKATQHFNTTRRVLMYDVYQGHSEDMPTTIGNATNEDIEIEYEVYATDSENTDETAAPPKIIIKINQD